jgi:hypothetical protein
MMLEVESLVMAKSSSQRQMMWLVRAWICKNLGCREDDEVEWIGGDGRWGRQPRGGGAWKQF